jgi:hypothetical protein
VLCQEAGLVITRDQLETPTLIVRQHETEPASG